MEVVLKVKILKRGINLETKVSSEIKVTELKQNLAKLSSVAPEQQRLIYLGKVLKDENILSDYKFKNGGTLHMVASAPPPASKPKQTSEPTAQPNFMDILDQMASQTSNAGPPQQAHIPASTPTIPTPAPTSGPTPNLESVLPQLLSSLGSGQSVSSIVATLMQSLGMSPDQTIGSMVNVGDAFGVGELGDLFSLILSSLTIGNIQELQQGNWRAIEGLHPTLATKTREWMGDKTVSDFSSSMVSQAGIHLDENHLPQEIKDQRKHGVDLTQITLGVFHDKSAELIDGILSSHTPTAATPFPFATFLKKWSSTTVGVLINSLEENVNGGKEGVMKVIKYFVTQRLYLLHSGYGPMAAQFIMPLITSSYNAYTESKMVETPLPEGQFSARNLSNDAIKEIIKEDITKQAEMKPQSPFSDAYLQGTPLVSRKRTIPSDLDPRQLLSHHLMDAVTSSGVATEEDKEKVRSLFDGNDHLLALYTSQLLKSFGERVSTDKDFVAEKFPNTNRILNKK